ncbi:MAG: DUF6351 family protein, partial [Janthinobacterium lividum]
MLATVMRGVRRANRFMGRGAFASGAAALLLAGCGSGSHGGDTYDVAVTTLSSPPQYVSGGSALIQIATNAPASKSVIVKINGTDVSSMFTATGSTGVMQGVATGMVTGSNTITAKIGSTTSSLQVTNYPITG